MGEQMREKSRVYIKYGLFAVSYGLLGAYSYRLYLRQAIQYPGPLGDYMSDLPAHIAEGKAHTAYSLMEMTLGFLTGTLRLNEKSVALFLALITTGTVFLMWRLLCRLYSGRGKTALHLLAFCCMFVMPLYLPAVNPCPYLGMQTGTIWHNSTYIGMKFAGTIVLLLYFRYLEIYRSGLSKRQWLLFTLALIFVNMMKPNFILCFAPAMALTLLSDCIADRGRTFGKQVLFGIPVLISLGVVIYETMVLFTGERSGSSIVFAIAPGLLAWNRHPVAALLQSAVFPLAIFLGNLPRLKKDRSYRFAWLIWLTGLLEYLCLSEDGVRKIHGNLSWGYSFCQFLIFSVCAGLLVKELLTWWTKCRVCGGSAYQQFCRATARERGRLLYLLVCSTLFLWHLYCGVDFFVMLMQGGSYLVGA